MVTKAKAAPDLSDPSTQAILIAFASSLLPLAGTTGIKIANLIPAAQALLMTFQNSGKVNYTAEDLAKIVSDNALALDVLAGHIAQMPDDAP